MKPGTAVWYVGDGGQKHLAFVTHDHGDGVVVDLIAIGPSGNSAYTSVPRRAPADYGPEGGGHTYHAIEG